jgi:hypothetical protein
MDGPDAARTNHNRRVFVKGGAACCHAAASATTTHMGAPATPTCDKQILHLKGAGDCQRSCAGRGELVNAIGLSFAINVNVDVINTVPAKHTGCVEGRNGGDCFKRCPRDGLT